MAIRHPVKMPCSSANGIVHNVTAPNFLPTEEFVFGFDDGCPGQWRHFAVIPPYSLVYDPIAIGKGDCIHVKNDEKSTK